MSQDESVVEIKKPTGTPRELKFVAIQEEIGNVLDIQSENLDHESLRSPKIFSKLQEYYNREVSNLQKELMKVDLLKAELRKYYLGTAPKAEYEKTPLRAPVIKSEVDDVIKVNERFLLAKFELQVQEQIVKYLEDAKKLLWERNFMIKNANDFRRLTQGGG